MSLTELMLTEMDCCRLCA